MAEIPINSIIVGDCRERMKQIPDESVDLIYLDPPFFSSKGYDLIWGGEDSKATIEAFEDAALYKKVCGKCGKSWRVNPKTGKYYATCYAGCTGKLKDTKSERMNEPEAFTEWLKDAIKECRRVLKPTGSIYCHLDWHAVHYVKVMMDGIFEYENFQNEIIWRRSLGHHLAAGMDVMTDHILWYSKTSDFLYNQQYEALDQKEMEKKFPMVEEETGRRFMHRQLEQAENEKNKGEVRVIQGKTVTTDIGWRWTQETFDKRLAENPYLVYWTKTGKPRYKIYADEYKGRKIGNLWIDIQPLASNSKERIGYDTQKPEALLKRIIKASSNEDDTVLDPFCGCGTTITVAQRLGRKWVGIDIEPLSCTVMQARMQDEFGIAVPLIDLEKTLTEDEAIAIIQQSHKMNPFEFQDWVVKVLGGKPNPAKSGDGGIDGWIDKQHGEWKKGDPIQVKMSAKVGDPVVKLFAFNTMHEGRDRGVIVAYSFSKTAESTAKKIREQDGVDIWLLTVKDMLIMTSKKTVKKAHEHQGGVQAKLQ